MSALQARQAALELQQELVELDIDVELQFKPIEKNLGSRGVLVLQTAVLEIDVGFGPSRPAMISIAEDGSIWGRDTAWEALFINGMMAFNGLSEWNPAELARNVKTAIPRLYRFQEAQNNLLKKIKKK